MKLKSVHYIIMFTIAASFFVAVFFYPLLPDKIASHWGVYGQADGYASKALGLFFPPILLIILDAFFFLIPNIDPLKKNIQSFREYFDHFILLMNFFLFYLYSLTIFWNLGARFNMLMFLMPAFAILFYYIGVMVGKAKRNYFIGIRTPWTLANDKVWEKTHKLGSVLFKLGALIFLVSVFFPLQGFVLLISYMIALIFFLFIYSYLEFRKEEPNGKRAH
ncbi:MAG: SdpI family protein [Candidatus Pacebacteria bacterium]|nr:SdpI family protein [Candidatus Paceibacterota bacterium]